MSEQKTGLEAVIEMFQVMDPKERARLLEDLKQKDPKVAAHVIANLFRFEDLPWIQAQELQLLMRQIPDSLLCVALRGVSDELIMRFLKAFPERKRRELLDEMKSRGPQLQSKISAAQEEIMRLAKELESDGKILLKKVDPNEDTLG